MGQDDEAPQELVDGSQYIRIRQYNVLFRSCSYSHLKSVV